MKIKTKLVSGIAIVATMLAVAALALAIRSRLVETRPAIGTVEHLVARFEHSHTGRIWYVNKFDPATGKMLELHVYWPLTNGTDRILIAESALHTNGVWTFYNARQFVAPTQSGNQGGEVVYPSEALSKTDVLAMPEFTEKPGEILALAKKSP